MQAPVLTERDRIPTWEVVSSHLGKSARLWRSLFDHIHRECPDAVETWRYYNDGKSWLLRVTRKGRTIFWLSVVPGTFRTTFYFTQKATDAVSKSGIAADLKEQLASGKSFGKLRAITILYRRQRDVEDAERLIAIKVGRR